MNKEGKEEADVQTANVWWLAFSREIEESAEGLE